MAGGNVDRPVSREAPRLPYDLPQLPIVRQRQPVFQAKLAVSAPDDEDERQADRVAEHVMRMPQPPASQAASDDNILRRKSPPGRVAGITEPPQILARKESASTGSRKQTPAPPIVQAGLRSPGQPLDAPTRAFFEPRFGHDFGHVRVHSDARAGEAADAVHARAYTSGHDIVFGGGEYAPSTPGGARLLAHELTHVGQQEAVASTATVQRDTKKDAPADTKLTKLAPPVADSIAAADADMAKQLKEKKYSINVYEPMNYRGLKALLPLAQAVDDDRASDIPKLVDAFIKAEKSPPFNSMSQEMLVEMSARLFTLGLEAESDKLRENYSEGVKKYQILNEDWGKSRRDIAIYKATVERTITMADASSPEKSKASLELMIRALDMLRGPILAVDQDRLAAESPDAWRYGPAEIMTLREYWKALIDVLKTLVTGIEMHLQLLLERAAADLGEGRGSATLLILRDIVENKLSPAIRSADGKKDMGGIRLTITNTEIKGGKGFLSDSLSKDPKSRSVAVSTYTPGQDYVRELESDLSGLVAIRIDQIATLARIYGATDVLRDDKPFEKEKKADAAKNADTMKKLIAQGGTLRLDSDTDWSQFVLLKYKDMTGPSAMEKGRALSAVISLLFDYLQAFTVHARFTNIYDQADFKDAYFDKPFPRTLAGQLVQDCGVYAMRVAYILSLVRQELGLRFRFIRLPVHVGLIITGDGLPVFLVHNDHVKEYSPEQVEEFYNIWEPPEVATKGGGTAPGKRAASPLEDDQFMGELSAMHDIEGPLDMPFEISEAPKTAKSALATKQALWAAYQKISSKDVFGSSATNKKSPGYLFHNRYLALTEMFREWSNEAVVPFWNVKAPANWAIFEFVLKVNGRTEIKGSELKPLLEAHLKQLDDDLKPVNARFERINDEERSIGRQLREDPELTAKGVRITHVTKLVMVHSWKTYRDNVQKLLADAIANPDQKFNVASIINTDLQPPFIPMPEKAMSVQF
ncbi:MAG TPA: DUF4157 domain-containing protein [Terriglobales bacterium]